MPTISKKKSENIKSEAIDDQTNFLLQQLKNQQAINNFAKALLKLKSVEEVVWSITENVITHLNLVDCVVYILDEKQNKLIQRAAYGPKNPTPKEIEGKLTINIGEGIVGSVALTGKAEIIVDTRFDKRYITDDENRLSEIAVPIILDDQIIGVIDSEHPEINFFNDFHLETLTVLASLSAASIKNALYHEELRKEKEKLEIEVANKIKDSMDTMYQLQRSNEDLKNYAHVVSHDLKQPLRSINSFLSLILRQEKNLSPKSQEYFNYVIDGTLKMENILNGLLEFSKVSDTELVNTSINLNKVLEDVKIGLAKQISETKTTIISSDLPAIVGYESLLHQLFQNLISNSIKFRRDGVNPIIKIQHTQNENQHHFSISDNGIGIPEKQRQSVFKMFTRLNNSANQEGTGLGLSFCKKIVERHHGEISISSDEINLGCTIQFTICKSLECKTAHKPSTTP